MGCMETTQGHYSSKTTHSLINALCLNETNKIIQLIKREPKVIGERINFRDDTIMHYAFYKENIELIRYLKKCGADFTMRNKMGKTPLDLTQSNEIKQIMGLQIQSKNAEKENIQYYFIRLGDIKVQSKQVNGPVSTQSCEKEQMKIKNFKQCICYLIFSVRKPVLSSEYQIVIFFQFFSSIYNNIYFMQQRYLIGTLFQEEELNKKMNVNNIKAKDPMGNVRWKGAFTGGFEAGFKNTCGSKEGWTPSTFVSSSINNNSTRKQQSIFDFMDEQDLGRGSIEQNISMKKNFVHQESNPLSITVNESAGQKMLNKMKKQSAFINAPEDIKELQKLLQNYEQQQILKEQILSYNLKGVEGYNSVGALNIPDDDFIVAYEDFFRKVIRAGVKQETEEEITKRRQENRVYFDFTRPLQQQPQYLKEIQDIDQTAKPKKKRKNILNDKNLKDLFKMGTVQLQFQENSKKFKDDVPEDYDPYHRIKNMKQKQKQFVSTTNEKKKHKIHSLNQRSDLLSEGKLASRFVSAGGSISSNKFMRTSQQQSGKLLEKVFDDGKKNQRYWDYVLELEGKKISAQLQYLSYEQAQKQKEQFQKVYKLRQVAKASDPKPLPKKVQEAIKSKNKRQVKVMRKTGTWRPERLLCKRFGCMLPYKQDYQNHKQRKPRRN